jgi:hypothetical protein
MRLCSSWGSWLNGSGLNDLAFLERCYAEPLRRVQDHHALALGLASGLGEGLLLLTFEGLIDLVDPAAIHLAVEGRRDGGAQGLHQLAHVALQGDSAPRRHLQGGRLLGIREVVDITPIRGCGPDRGLALQGLAHQRVLAYTGTTEGIEIKAGVFDPDPESQRLQCPILAQHLPLPLRLGRGLKPQQEGIAGGAQPAGRELQRLGTGFRHRRPPANRNPSSRVPHPGVAGNGDPCSGLTGSLPRAPSDRAGSGSTAACPRREPTVCLRAMCA